MFPHCCETWSHNRVSHSRAFTSLLLETDTCGCLYEPEYREDLLEEENMTVESGLFARMKLDWTGCIVACTVQLLELKLRLCTVTNFSAASYFLKKLLSGKGAILCISHGQRSVRAIFQDHGGELDTQRFTVLLFFSEQKLKTMLLVVCLPDRVLLLQSTVHFPVPAGQQWVWPRKAVTAVHSGSCRSISVEA